MISNTVINTMVQKAQDIRLGLSNSSNKLAKSGNISIQVMGLIGKFDNSTKELSNRHKRFTELSKLGDKLYKLCYTHNNLYDELPKLINSSKILSSQDKRLLSIYLYNKSITEFRLKYGLGGN